MLVTSPEGERGCPEPVVKRNGAAGVIWKTQLMGDIRIEEVHRRSTINEDRNFQTINGAFETHHFTDSSIGDGVKWVQRSDV